MAWQKGARTWRICWMLLTAPVPKWATVLSSSRRFRMGIRSAHPGGDGLSSWYTSKNRPDVAGRGLLHSMDRSVSAHA